ncbi:MAG: DUF4290 domain-containing protein [Bacteroidales bacterium]|nr:DUF4290 domain-containing protein [Bacteroidales bacterium]HNW74571.1 DUF4290 domain-containing protein [Bacteroidales bacterium]HPS50118.1 DUF4290 domain-containing protein [Bacteroidales bacterium]
MEYNTTREAMFIPEYGRNIQRMIQYICTIEDREKRNQAAKFIINVMAQMHPGVKESGDYKHKLWDHLFIISDFKLDVDAPFPPPPPLSLSTKPEHLSYHDKEIEFKHYGKNIALMIEKATEYTEGAEKDALVHAIANHMKKSYLNWNRESVNDELIEKHLEILSKDQLKLHQDFRFTHTNDILAQNQKRKPFRQGPERNFNKQGFPKQNFNSQRGRNKPQ